jgi:hypothetical protein
MMNRVLYKYAEMIIEEGEGSESIPNAGYIYEIS